MSGNQLSPFTTLTSHSLDELRSAHTQLAMVTHLTDPELGLVPHSDSPAATEYQKAWHLLSLLLAVRRPAPLAELASRCTLFPAPPDLIQHLCSIPNSPLFLIANSLVTLSPLGLAAFGEFVSNSNLVGVLRPRPGLVISSPKRLWEGVRMYSRKRRRTVPDYEVAPVAKRRICFDPESVGEGDQGVRRSEKTIGDDIIKALFRLSNSVIDNLQKQHNNLFGPISDLKNLNKVTVKPSLLGNSSSQQLTCTCKNVELLEDCTCKNLAVCEKVHEHVHESEYLQNFCPVNLFPNTPSHITAETLMNCEPDQIPTLSNIILGDPVVLEEANGNVKSHKIRTTFSTVCCLEEVKEKNASSMMIGNGTNDCEFTNDRIVEDERIMTDREVEMLDNVGCSTRENDKLSSKFKICDLNEPPENDFEMMNSVNCMTQSMEKEQRTTCVERQFTISATELSVAEKQPSKPFAKMKSAMTPRMRALYKSVEHTKAAGTSKEQHHYKRNQMSISTKQNRNDVHVKERRENTTSVSLKDQMEPKALPDFESFIVEDEEGSGGYGTVYRAQRKTDGITVAIKCPHANAHKHHVTNELKMLERFGGKNFVIKYEGCFKSNDSDCFVLEHVEHDRPEVLKKDIDVFQLQWYGYCMFRALASLHKQGIVHRDVKPGNFLFSRKTSKGYLIDFNLAMDLHQKYGTNNKAKAKSDVNFGHSSLPNVKSVSPRKSASARSAVFNKEAMKIPQSTLEKNLKRSTVEQKHLGSWNTTKSKGADGSGITSGKDVTSTRTPSAERRRQPLPSHGRKELINLLQESMQTHNHGASHVPAPLRKRVAASPGQLDKTLFYLTPMPLDSTSLAVAGAGLSKNKGDGKLKREGPCVGTKGFRAPEVLFRSLHQGPKVDVWSAGVTLLYLMTGRTPFFGDPEQNIKEIAKLRGSEDLWELAKLHNRDSSFPVELYDVKFLPSLKLRDWCEANTKRPDFLKVMPRSLFDLVDECLTINPRRRISAEDALKHEFFAPCHEKLRKQRLIRQGLSLETGTSGSSL